MGASKLNMAHSYDKRDKLGRFIKGEKTKRVCLYCKQEYYDVPTRRNKFCSRQCADAWRKGKHLSEKTKKILSKQRKGKKPKNLDWLHKLPRDDKWRKKMSKAMKGKKRTKPVWNKGISPSKITRDKIRKALLGSKSSLWKDGRCKDKKYMSWLSNKRNRMPKIGSHTFGEWELLKKQYGFRCPACEKLELEIKLTQDHIIPLSKGGSDYIENIQPLCGSCNSKKHTKIIKYDKCL